METDDFRDNNIDTAWLDKRIKNAPTPVRNHAGLVVLVGSAVQVYAAAAKARAAFTAALGRGQFPDQSLLKTQHNLDIILDGVKYQVAAALHGPSSLLLTVNDTTVVAKVRCSFLLFASSSLYSFFCSRLSFVCSSILLFAHLPQGDVALGRRLHRPLGRIVALRGRLRRARRRRVAQRLHARRCDR